MTEHPSSLHPRRLVSVGNVVVDVTTHVDTWPERGGDQLATSSEISPGGSFNTLVAAVRQGLPGAYAGVSGTGPFGDLVRTRMRDADVEVLLPPTHDSDTGYVVVIVEPDGERSFVTSFGAEATLTAKQLESVAMQPGDILHVSGYGLLDRTNGDVIPAWLFGLPAEHLVLVDPGPLVSSISSGTLVAVLERADWVSCNEREARQMTGRSTPQGAASALAESGTGVVIRLGAQGCLLRVDGETTLIPGFAVKAVDSNGAGDAHVGAFLAALASGLTPVAAARRANACAAIAVTRTGPATAPTLAETERLL
jgi:sugar/nucleoside kinase (ribokinase family)